jgi:crossover junction endodeoxyribonuclease RuvC
MRIIGIDPGTIACGYGVVESGVKSKGSGEKKANLITHNSSLIHVASGDIKLHKKDPLPHRLKILYDSLQSVINEHQPSEMCIEKIFYHKSIRSALALGTIRGIALLLAAENSIPVFEYNSTQLKMALTGYGRAEKRQVQEMVKIILGLSSSKERLSEDQTGQTPLHSVSAT